MIYCCGGLHKPSRTVLLSPEFIYTERKLEILVCPVCGAVIAMLTRFNVKTQKYEIIRPKQKKTLNFIKEAESGKWREIKYGTREKAGFVFGLNRENKDGTIYQYASDFNGVKRLIKIIDKTGRIVWEEKRKNQTTTNSNIQNQNLLKT